MATVIKKPGAESDLDEIWWYIAEDNPNAATKFLRRIDEVCKTLANFPGIGVEYKRYRMHSVKEYRIFYTPLEDGVEIVRVLHSARDIESMF